MPIRDIDREINVVGLEYEFLNSRRDTDSFAHDVRRYIPGWSIIHDASCEGAFQTLGKVPVVFSDKDRREQFSKLTTLPFETFGGEVTSPILQERDITESVHRLCDFFLSQREFADIRSSLHVHCNVGNSIPLYVLKAFLRMILGSESFLYRVGGMGETNRGLFNHFIFQRPYSKFGPPCYKQNRTTYPIFETSALLEVDSRQDFFNMLGDSVRCIAHDNKYVTQRYMGTNFYSILKRESIEFRYANTTLKPDYVLAWIDYLRAFVRKSFMTLDEYFYEERPLNHVMTEGDVIDYLDLFDISCTNKCILLDIWKESGDLSDYKIVPVYSHLDNPSGFENGNPYEPYPAKDIVEVERINIHTLMRDISNTQDRSKMWLMQLSGSSQNLENKLNNAVRVGGLNIEYDRLAELGILKKRAWQMNAPQQEEEFNEEEIADMDDDDDDIPDDEEDYDYLQRNEISPMMLQRRPNPSIPHSMQNGTKMTFMRNGFAVYNQGMVEYTIFEMGLNGRFIYEVRSKVGNVEHCGYRVADRVPSISWQGLLDKLTYIY